MLHTVLDGLGLEKLGRIDEGIKVIGIEESLVHVVHDLAIGRIVPLVPFHHIGEHIPVFGEGETFHGL
jgi:hypothetical protein